MHPLWKWTGTSKERQVIMKTEDEINTMSMEEAMVYLRLCCGDKTETPENRVFAGRMLLGYIRFARECE